MNTLLDREIISIHHMYKVYHIERFVLLVMKLRVRYCQDDIYTVVLMPCSFY